MFNVNRNTEELDKIVEIELQMQLSLSLLKLEKQKLESSQQEVVDVEYTEIGG